MEWTKEELHGKCILITSKKHGKRVIEFFRSFGFDDGCSIRNDEIDILPGRIIGISTMRFQINTIDPYVINANPRTYKLIKLPASRHSKFPREMMVSDDKINWTRKLVLGKIKSNSPFATAIGERRDFYENQVFKYTSCHKYAKEIESEEDNTGKLSLF